MLAVTCDAKSMVPARQPEQTQNTAKDPIKCDIDRPQRKCWAGRAGVHTATPHSIPGIPGQSDGIH